MNSGSIKNTVNLHGSIISLGARGYSNYEIAVQNGFEGTEQEWLDSLVGPVGPRGPIGPNNFHVGEEEPEDENVSVWLDTDEPIPNTFVPVATEETLGTIKPGNNLKVDKNGKLEMTIYANNVEEMVNSKLKTNDVVQTLGYHEPNDGGGALYLIREKTQDDVEDKGSIHFVGDKLVAELIIQDSINVKQFGAKGDSVTDDTQSFKNLYKFITDKIGNEFFTSNSYVALLTSGKYLVSERVEIPIYVKTKIEGSVLILSNVATGSTIKYTSNGKVAPNGMRVLRNASFNDGEVISGNGILAIQRNNGDDDINNELDSIGLEIGDIEINNNINLSRCKFNNITISGFKKALQLNMNDVYLVTFNNLHTENDKYGVCISEHIDNSGENISFNNCIFSHHYNAIFIDSDGLAGLNFDQCSFDFNGNHILLNTDGNVLINCNSCHFEGVGFVDSVINANEENTVGFSSIFHRNTTNVYSKSLCVLDNCFIHLNSFNQGKHLFTALNTGGKHSIVKLKDCGFSVDWSKLNFDNRFMCDDNTEIELSAPKIDDYFIPYMGSSDDNLGKFNHIPNDLNGNWLDSTFKETFKKTGYGVNVNDWSSLPVNISIDTSNKVFDKSIVVEQNAFNTYCVLVKEIYNLNKNYLANTCYLQVGNITFEDTTVENYEISPVISYKFYDKYDNLIETRDITLVNNSYKKDEWICSSTYVKIPVNAFRCSVNVNMILKNGNAYLNYKGSILYGGIITELMD